MPGKGRLPNFLCIGGGRCGTTWLYQALKKHPQAFVPPNKEVCFFIRDQFRSTWSKGLDWYQSLFDFPDTGQIKAWGELSPRYYFLDRTPKLVRDVISEVKLIYLVRQPVEMLASLAAFHTNMFPAAVRADRYGLYEYLDNHMVEPLGFFAKHYRRWAEHFPSEQIFVGCYDDLRASPAALFESVCKFLGLDVLVPADQLADRVNVSRFPRSFWMSVGFDILSRKVSSKFYGINNRVNRVEFRQWRGRHAHLVTREQFQRLMDVYEEDIADLQSVLGRDLSHWFQYENLDPTIRSDIPEQRTS